MATDDLHSPTPEELMEYLDGEGAALSRAAIEAHLATCATCQTLAAEHYGLSREMAAWQVTIAPSTLQAPATTGRSRWWLSAWLMQPRAAVVTVAAVAAGIVLVSIGTVGVRRAMEPPTVAKAEDRALVRTPEPPLPGRGGSGGNLQLQAPPTQAQRAAQAVDQLTNGTAPPVRALIRTATLELIATNFGAVRGTVERIVSDAGGFADQLSVSADPGSARVLRATLRVPGDRLADTLARLRTLGQVTQDQQKAEDVSDQLVDLDARLKNARATEERLTDLLRDRTGKLSDVLEVEQELARVRLDIERLDAEKTNTSRRVAYAAIDLTIREEAKSGFAPGPLPLATQLRLASAEGLQNVIDTLVGLALLVLRAGPTLLLWLLGGTGVWTLVRRPRRARKATAA